MRRIDIGLGALVALVGVVVLDQARALRFYDGDVPGPGFMPTLLAAALVISGLALVATRLARPGAAFAEASLPDGRSAVKVASVAGALFVGLLLMPLVGFVAAMIVLVAVLLLGVERLRSLPAVLAIVAVPIGFFVLFDVVLRVPLPEGPLGF